MRRYTSLFTLSLLSLACNEGAPPHGALDSGSGGRDPGGEHGSEGGAGGENTVEPPEGQQCDGNVCLSCATGFGPPEAGCPDLNECLNPELCEGGSCRNSVGSYYCDCPDGSEEQNGHCEARDRCALSPCDDSATCIQNGDSFDCACPPGSVSVENGCREQAACMAASCGPGADCLETASGYQCACPSGTSGNQDCDTLCDTLNLDPALEALVREQIGLPAEAGPLKPIHVAGLTRLDASLTAVKTTAGLECWVDLEELDLSGSELGQGASNPEAPLAALAGLPRLRALNLSCTHVESLEPLTGHVNLRELRVNNSSSECSTSLNDVHAVATLSQLQRLDLQGHGLSSLPSLEKLSRLSRLNLAQNALTSLESLKALRLLEELDISQNRLTSLQSGSSLISLKKLNLGHNELDSLSPLQGLTSLTELRAPGNELSNIPEQTDWPRLRILDLGLNDIVKLDRIAGLTTLVELNLVANQLTTLAPLIGAGFVGRLNALANPLACESEDASLELLAKQGAQVLSDCAP